MSKLKDFILSNKVYSKCSEKEQKEIEACLRYFEKLHSRDKAKFLEYECNGYIEEEVDTAICPNCLRKFDIENEEHYFYCPTCGQALDWEEENDETDEVIEDD